MLSADAARPHRAAIVGSPVDHSLSPSLHRAAYAALGLHEWTFTRVEIGRGELARYVEGLGPEWVGLAVTMPLKEEALALADAVGTSAEIAGAANTLTRQEAGGWFADNTDVHGIATALTEAGLRGPRRATVLGGGATARSALVALHGLGVREASVVVRADLRPETRTVVERLGLEVTVHRFDDGPVVLDGDLADTVVSTLPATAGPYEVLVRVGPLPVVMDVVYAPWPSPFARAVAAASGGRVPVVGGTEMLLHQAVRQVRLMTGRDGPLASMRRALEQEEQETG